MAGTLGSQGKAAVTTQRGYYRIPRKNPANRVDGVLAEVVRAKFSEGWPKAHIAREFRLDRRTVIRICATPVRNTPATPLSPFIRCVGCGITIRQTILKAHWPNCPAVREGQLSLEDCPV